MRKAMVLFMVLLAAVAAVAQAPQHPSPVDPSLAVSLPNGLTYWDLAVGLGKEAVKGSKVKVHYTGWLLEEGTKFDSSLDRGKPLEFTLGAGTVIKGWEIGVQGMKVGGKRQLRIPPELAYGYRGQPPDIPSDAYLIFDVELLEVE
ncbi:MAG: FKBP-type peptidyl-prolyl cis-trans isomerase [Acidobacteriota bacterium]|nr:FKBP-type peptidyl-prolyl cis-trans isomerase [Acidobacteriota bacterium]